MIGSGNSRIYNVIGRRNHQNQGIQELDDTDKDAAPKSKYYYQNAYNNIIKNNDINNNSMNKQNNNRNIKIKNVNNINNNNVIRSMKSFGGNNNINKALMVIKNEFWKKDEKIKALELKIADLENKINMITKSNNYQSNNSNIISINPKKVINNYRFIEKYSEEINSSYKRRNNNNTNKTPEMSFTRGNNLFKNPQNNQNINNSYLIQTKSANKFKINSSEDNEIKKSLIQSNSITNDVAIEGSVFTGNSSNFPHHSKSEVKSYLKEVKSKVDPIIFKEFIKNIKLLTNSKNKNRVDKNSVIEKIRLLFGEQFKDLFIKFQAILGYNV